MEKKSACGIDSFEKMIRLGYYYIDKTMLIKDLLYPLPNEATLITRPRRFGKSLSLSMLECFLDIARKEEETSLFEGLAILNETEVCDNHMHRYPVIHVSFSNVTGNTRKPDPENAVQAIEMLKAIIWGLATKYDFLLDSDKLNDADKESYKLITARRTAEEIRLNPDLSVYLMDNTVLAGSLKTLTILLEKHYGERSVILVDEYDVPLNNAYEYGYYDEFVNTYSTILAEAMKTNNALAFSIITGCLRISKESIFTGFNNLIVNDVMDDGMFEHFGFSDDDVSEMLKFFGLDKYHEAVRNYYDGYCFGGKSIYNPWAVNLFVEKASESIANNMEVRFQREWLNTSRNDILKRLLGKACDDNDVMRDLEKLGKGNVISKPLVTELTFDTMYDNVDALWTVMLHAGYLTCEGISIDGIVKLRVPNEEVLQAFEKLVTKATIRRTGKGKFLDSFCQAVESFNVPKMQEELNKILRNASSLRDLATKSVRENYYHGIMNAVLLYRDDWDRSSNPETGEGYCDVMIEDQENEWGVIFELKYSYDALDFTAALEEAEKQIKTCEYSTELKEKEYPVIHLYAIAFHGKKCVIKEVFD